MKQLMSLDLMGRLCRAASMLQTDADTEALAILEVDLVVGAVAGEAVDEEDITNGITTSTIRMVQATKKMTVVRMVRNHPSEEDLTGDEAVVSGEISEAAFVVVSVAASGVVRLEL